MTPIAIADLFCGAGGTSTGAVEALELLGFKPTLTAINHWDIAIATPAQIDALIALTPTDYFHKEDFEREGIRDWQDWIARIIKHSEHVSQIMA